MVRIKDSSFFQKMCKVFCYLYFFENFSFGLLSGTFMLKKFCICVRMRPSVCFGCFYIVYTQFFAFNCVYFTVRLNFTLQKYFTTIVIIFKVIANTVFLHVKDSNKILVLPNCHIKFLLINHRFYNLFKC
jgi:hypothetical protein